MPDLKISELPSLAGNLLQETDPVAVADLSASETKSLTALQLATGIASMFPAASIPSTAVAVTIPAGSIDTDELADDAVTADKLADNSSAVVAAATGGTGNFIGQLHIDTTTNYGYYWDNNVWTSLTTEIVDKSIAGAKLADNSSAVVGTTIPATADFTGQLYIDTTTNYGSYWNGTAWTSLTPQLGANSVTATELADNSSAVIGTPSPAAGAFTGQFHIDTDTNEGYYWDGSVWTGFRGEAAVGSIATGTGSVVITPVAGTTAGEIKLNTAFTSSTAPAQFVAGPTASAGAVDYRSIIGADLPTAGTAKGAVAVSGNGLRMDGETLEIDNDILASTAFNVVQVDVKGLVTGYQSIGPTDLPIATTSTLGAVMIGDGIAISGTGSISLDEQSGSGEFTKVTINDRGIVTTGAELAAADIPDLPAEKLTSGFLNVQRIASHTIEREKLAPYSIAFIQEASPATDDATLFAGCLWFQESTAQLRIWNANAWTSVGFGRLAADNLRFGGTISAASGNVTGLTSAGITAGLTMGTDLPVATDGLGGLYLVVDEAGSNINVTPGYSYDPGDWVLCISEGVGWVRIDTLSGGGGGGSDTIAGLLDTLITAPTEGDVLVYGSNALWTNEAILSGGVY